MFSLLSQTFTIHWTDSDGVILHGLDRKFGVSWTGSRSQRTWGDVTGRGRGGDILSTWSFHLGTEQVGVDLCTTRPLISETTFANSFTGLITEMSNVYLKSVIRSSLYLWYSSWLIYMRKWTLEISFAFTVVTTSTINSVLCGHDTSTLTE